VAVIAIFLYCGITIIMASQRIGGISEKEKQSNDEVQGFIQSLSSEIKSSALALFTESDGGANDASKQKQVEEHFKTANMTAMGHKTQLVAGTNYFVRTKIGDYIFHVRIYRDLQKNVSLSKVIGPKNASDPIEYF